MTKPQGIKGIHDIAPVIERLRVWSLSQSDSGIDGVAKMRWLLIAPSWSRFCPLPVSPPAKNKKKLTNGVCTHIKVSQAVVRWFLSWKRRNFDAPFLFEKWRLMWASLSKTIWKREKEKKNTCPTPAPTWREIWVISSPKDLYHLPVTAFLKSYVFSYTKLEGHCLHLSTFSSLKMQARRQLWRIKLEKQTNKTTRDIKVGQNESKCWDICSS